MEAPEKDFNLTILYKRIDSFKSGYRQNIAILADDKDEISNLLNAYFINEKASQLIHIHINPTYLTKKDVLKSVSFCLLSEYTSIATSLDQLINICSESLPKTTSLIKSLLQKDISLPDLLLLINKFIEESNKSCLFILEEFLLADKLFKNFYQIFANFAISQRKCMLVVTSSYPDKASKTLGNELNFLFGNFEKIHLNKNNFFQNFFFLKNNLNSLNLSPNSISFFVNIIGDNKTYYRIFVKKIKELCTKSEEETIINVLDDLLLKKEGYFFQKFSSKIDRLTYHFKTSKSVFKLLFLLSKGYMRKNSLREVTGMSNGDLTNKLNKLLNLNYLNKHGNIYKVKDSLFAFWLAHIFKFYSVFAVFDVKKRKKLWTKEIQDEISLFKEEFLKNRLKKVLELFMAFQDDFLAVDKDKYSLPRLNRVKIISYPEDNFHLLVGEGKKIVFAGIKEKTAEDKDILSFIQRGSSIKGKNIQKIFISLDRLSDTAKLLAKNKKIPIWDRAKVNQLLNIYNKPNFLQYL